MYDVLPPTDAGSRIRAIARSSVALSFHPHAKRRMEERGITYGDLLAILRTGRVTDSRCPEGYWRYEMRGTSDGDKLSVVAEIRGDEQTPQLRVITAWRN